MKNAPYLVNLQICRALAALSVVLGHSLHDLDALGLGTANGFVNWGAGVDVFFVISGFIMIHVAGGDFGRRGAPLRFFARRLTRIAPLYWILTTTLILGALIAPGLLNTPIGGWRHILFSYLFLPDWRPDMSAVRPVMALGWTLNYEMLFYVVFSCALLLPIRVGVAGVATAFAAAALLHGTLDGAQTQLAFWSDPIALEFVLGMGVGCVARAGWRIGALPAAALAIGGVLLIGYSLPALAVPDTLRFLRCGFPAAMLIAAAALGPAFRSERWIPGAVLLGDSSYALYLSHPFIIRPMRELWRAVGAAAFPGFAFPLAAACAAISAALLLHMRVEAPLNVSLRRLIEPRKPNAKAPPNAAAQASPAA